MKITIYEKNPQVGHTSFVKVGNKWNDRKSNCQTVHVPLENPGYCIIIYHILCTKI